MPLDSLPGHSEAVLDGLGGFCKCTICGNREVMLAFLGASWRSWFDSGLKPSAKMAPKLVQNWSKKWAKTGPIFDFVFGPTLKGFATLPGAPSSLLCPGGSLGPASRARYS